MEHSFYDKRKYPIVDVQEGYGEWVQTYENIVEDEMDIRLLNRLENVDWSNAESILDFACGTGRIGAWLRERTDAPIDGVDLTAEMLAVAKTKNIYRALHHADVTNTGLPADRYDICTQSLADEHLPNLEPLYQEVARVTKTNGYFVLVGFHPQFLMAGMPTHYDNSAGETRTIRSYVHLFSDHVKSAHAAGWQLVTLDECLVDEAWLAKKPKWDKYLGIPISFLMLWQKVA